MQCHDYYQIKHQINLLFQKQCTGTEFTVQGDLVKCGVTETETCLKSVTLALLDGTNVRKRKHNIPLSISNL